MTSLNAFRYSRKNGRMPKKKGVSVEYLDSIFSNYIRLRDADEDGYVICCNCGKRLHWKEAQNGHYVKRRHQALRWDERNCHAECAECNNQDINLGYAKFMVKRYGEDIWDKLQAQKNIHSKIMPHERQIMANNYRKKIAQLKKEKGL